MSRVLNIRATEAELAAMCVKLGIGVSVIEPLPAGGSRIVLDNMEATESLRCAMTKRIIDGPTQRSSLHVARTQPSYLR